jgi:hypothetical protein
MVAVFAFDPGGTVGSVAWRPGVFICHEHPFEEFPDFARRTLDAAFWVQPVEVVGERFVIKPDTLKKTREGTMQAIETIGVMRDAARQRGLRFTLQPVSDVKAFATDNLLKRLGLYRPGMGHAMDATRHLVAYLAREHKPAFADLLRRPAYLAREHKPAFADLLRRPIA